MVSEIYKYGIKALASELDEKAPGWADKIQLERLTTLLDYHDPKCPGSGCVAFNLHEANLARELAAAYDDVLNRGIRVRIIPDTLEQDKEFLALWHAEILTRRAPVSLPPKLLAKCVEMAKEAADYRLAK